MAIQPNGKPASGFFMAIVGRPGSVSTDAEGQFSICPDPTITCTAVVTSPAGGPIRNVPRPLHSLIAGGGTHIEISSFEDFGGAFRYFAATSAGDFRLGLQIDRAQDVGKPATDSKTLRSADKSILLCEK